MLLPTARSKNNHNKNSPQEQLEKPANSSYKVRWKVGCYGEAHR
jgi:hypothetical protein